MLYSILIYDKESTVSALSPDEDAARVAKHVAFQNRLAAKGKLHPVARLMPTTTAVTLRPDADEPVVLDGPYAETKEQLVGFYVIDSPSLEEAIVATRELPLDSGAIEIRPIAWYRRGS